MKIILQNLGDIVIQKVINSSNETVGYWIMIGLILENVAIKFGVELE